MPQLTLLPPHHLTFDVNSFSHCSQARQEFARNSLGSCRNCSHDLVRDVYSRAIWLVVQNSPCLQDSTRAFTASCSTCTKKTIEVRDVLSIDMSALWFWRVDRVDLRVPGWREKPETIKRISCTVQPRRPRVLAAQSTSRECTPTRTAQLHRKVVGPNSRLHVSSQSSKRPFLLLIHWRRVFFLSSFGLLYRCTKSTWCTLGCTCKPRKLGREKKRSRHQRAQ